MKDIDRATEVMFELARTVVTEMRSHHPTWQQAFVRLASGDGFFEVKCSYVLPEDVCMLDVLRHRPFVQKLKQLGLELRESSSNLGRHFRVALLRVGADLDCEVQYDFDDATRWSISKIAGGTGLPVGYKAA